SDYFDWIGSTVSSEQFWSVRFLPGAANFLAGGADRSRSTDVAESGQRPELTGGADEHTGKMPVPELHDSRADRSGDRNHDRRVVFVARNARRAPGFSEYVAGNSAGDWIAAAGFCVCS